jgi:5'(3')-deoxyribonucleotidase
MKYDSNKKTIGVDVDLTTLRSDKSWWIWLKNMAEKNTLPHDIEDFIGQGNEANYNISSHFPPMQNRNVDPFDFWRQEGVYDTIPAVDGAVENIKLLMNDFNIVFVTHNKGNGGRSKFNNLDRLFGRGTFGYVVTREKFLVKMDVIVDDRNDFLNMCAKNGIPSIKIHTPFIQYESPHNSLVNKRDWNEIYDHLINTLK